MGTSQYFNNFAATRINEQLLMEDLIVESIQIQGHDIYYMPRESWDDTDPLYGENISSRFERAYPIEMYIANVEGFQGDQDFFSRFGLEIRDNTNFVVARRSFEKYVPSTLAPRPREGDLLWVPVMNRIFEVKFVEEENFFFAIGNKLPYVYELRCEVFRYSNETINTGIDEIDNVEEDTSYTVQMIVTGNGNFVVGETVFQGPNITNATMTATVSNWDPGNTALYLIDINGDVASNANLVGTTSNTTYLVTLIDTMGDYVYYDSFDNKLIQDEANNFIDLSERNPFGLP